MFIASASMPQVRRDPGHSRSGCGAVHPQAAPTMLASDDAPPAIATLDARAAAPYSAQPASAVPAIARSAALRRRRERLRIEPRAGPGRQRFGPGEGVKCMAASMVFRREVMRG